MNVPATLEFDDQVRRQVYEHVERNGETTRDELLTELRVDGEEPGSKPPRSGPYAQTTRIPPEVLGEHLAALTESGYLAESDGVYRVALAADAVEHETDEGTVAIRPARQADREGIVELIREVAGERTSIVAETVAEAIDREAAVLRYNERQSRMLLVAALDDAVVGWVHVDGPELAKLRHTAELTVGVDADHRREGVGGQLLDRGLEWAAAAGYEKVYQSLPATNEVAIEFLEEHDWTVEGVREDHYRVGDGYVDEVQLATWVG